MADGTRNPGLVLSTRHSPLVTVFSYVQFPKSALQKKIRDLTEEDTAELELATDEALGRVEPPPKWQQLAPGVRRGN
jgi:hypothetical protein